MRLCVRGPRRLTGAINVPGDKSISHRAALLGAVAEGPTEVTGYLEAEDCLGTVRALEALGVEITRKGAGHYRIAGVGLHGLQEPDQVLDCGNSGTTARLLLGLLAGQPFCSILTGDDSLRRRPMGRVTTPLRQMGATVLGRSDGGRLPLAIRGGPALAPIVHRTPVASAQVKSAVLLAGLWATAAVTVEEPARSRDHTERMLAQFGARLRIDDRRVTLEPGSTLRATAIQVPGDISSAAFFLVAGVLAPGSRLRVEGMSLNPTRTGILEALEAMNARLTRPDAAAAPGEPAGTVEVESSALRATSIGGDLVPRLIDEVPVLAVAATRASGVTVIRDAADLRVKESDRIAALATELTKLGARVDERADGLAVHGDARLAGARVDSHGDHRIAMALVVAGLVADGETVVEDTACIATSFPGFVATVNSLAGAEAVRVEA
jgi:3-phosphoshikimate 1-carboxyvinyltransferase